VKLSKRPPAFFALIILILAAFVYSLVFFFRQSTATPQVASLQTWLVGSPITAIAVSPDGNIVAIGRQDGKTQLRSRIDGHLTYVLEGHTSKVSSIAFSPDGELLATGSGDQTVRIWQIADAALVRTLTGHGFPVNTVAFRSDGQTLAVGSRDIHLWQVKTGKLEQTLYATQNSAVRAIAFSQNGSQVFAAWGNGVTEKWELPSGRLSDTQDKYQEQFKVLRSVAFSRDRQIMAMAWYAIPHIDIWAFADGRKLRTLEGHQTDIWSLAFSPDGQFLASGGGLSGVDSANQGAYAIHDRTVHMWRLSDGSEVAKFAKHLDSVGSLAWTPDSKLLFSGGDDGMVFLWQVSK